MDIIYHYPPELMNLLIDALPRLFRSKKDLLLFFKGAGVPRSLYSDLEERVHYDRENINKFEIARIILQRLNDKGEATLGERRVILKRVTEFEDFSTCWPKDQLEARGLVEGIRKIIDVKDSFTRMKEEKEKEKKKHRETQQEKLDRIKEQKASIEKVKKDLFSLFSEQDPYKRGKSLESVLNRLFDIYGILVREAFCLKGSDKEGIVEQLDGVIEIDGNHYLVEVKWESKPLGKEKTSSHLVRIYHRGQARGILISASGFSDPAITICKESLQRTVVVLCELQEIVQLLELEKKLKWFLREKINYAITDKNPFHKPL